MPGRNTRIRVECQCIELRCTCIGSRSDSTKGPSSCRLLVVIPPRQTLIRLESQQFVSVSLCATKRADSAEKHFTNHLETPYQIIPCQNDELPILQL